MSGRSLGYARAVYDLVQLELLASVHVPASPGRVFRALASRDVVQWWERPGIFTTSDWTGDVKAGGRWRASGVGKSGPWVLEGEFTTVESPRKLVHTWEAVGQPEPTTTVTYHIDDKLEDGTRVTLRHSGFASPKTCMNSAIAWETSFERLAHLLATESK